MATKLTTLEKSIEKHISYWQAQLRLLDWDITYEVRETPDEGYAHMKHWPTDQRAHMTITDPSKIPGDWVLAKDLEVTIVHELLHTRFLYATPIKAFRNNVHEEMAIETCARAMVALRRGVGIDDLE